MIFSSKTPRDLNHDPRPLSTIGTGRRVQVGSEYAGETVLNPRPEFDHVQHNPPNPILVLFRKGYDGDMRGWGAWLLFASSDMLRDEECTQDHVDHARRVLARLAAMA